METGQEICPIYQEIIDWYEAVVIPKLVEWFKHIAQCQACQEKVLQKMLEGQDEVGLKILLADKEQLYEALKKYQE